MTLGGFARVLRWVFLPAVAVVSFCLAGIVCQMCQVLAHRDAQTERVEGRIVSRDQTAVPVSGDFATSYTLLVGATDGRLFRIAGVEQALDLRPGGQVVLDVSRADGSVLFVRAGTAVVDLRPDALTPVLLIAGALAGLGGVLFGGIRWSTCPPLLIWLFLVAGAAVAPLAVFVRF